MGEAAFSWLYSGMDICNGFELDCVFQKCKLRDIGTINISNTFPEFLQEFIHVPNTIFFRSATGPRLGEKA